MTSSYKDLLPFTLNLTRRINVKTAKKVRVYPISFNPGLSTTKLIKLGGYDWVQHIDEYEAKNGVSGVVEIRTLSVPRDKAADFEQTFLPYLNSKKVRLATPEEALHFGYQHKDAQTEGVLATIFRQFATEIAIALGKDSSGRYVRCYGNWQQFCDPFAHFLVVRI